MIEIGPNLADAIGTVAICALIAVMIWVFIRD